VPGEAQIGRQLLLKEQGTPTPPRGRE